MVYSTIVGRIDRISGSGNGILDTIEREYNLGPIPKEATGNRALALPLNTMWAVCLTPYTEPEEYLSQFSATSGIELDKIRETIRTAPVTRNEEETRPGIPYVNPKLESGSVDEGSSLEVVISSSGPEGSYVFFTDSLVIRVEKPSLPAGYRTTITIIDTENPVWTATTGGSVSSSSDTSSSPVQRSDGNKEISSLERSSQFRDPLDQNIADQSDLNGTGAGDNRRMTADRFYGGVNGRLGILRQMLEYIKSSNPAQNDLVDWILSNSRAQSDEAVVHHLNFIKATGLIQYSDDRYSLTNRGEQYLSEEDSFVLYQALQSGVKGFETILTAMQNEPMTDEAIMDLLVGEFEECNMTTPGVAARHREWLEALGFVQGTNEGYTLTDDGRAALDPSTFYGRDSEEPELDLSRGSLHREDASQSRGADINPEVLQELRSEAEEVATDDPSRDGVISTTSKYVRSPAIKKYAKARAGGQCEWCKNPAPFRSKTGGPYLEVHHVEELGRGGSDSPEKVVALCPTCHTHVHYGEGGDELNAQIQEKLETELEPDE